MKAFYKRILICLGFILSCYESFSCQSVDYVFGETPINQSHFAAENISDRPDLVTKIFGITEETLFEMYRNLNLLPPYKSLGKGECYFKAFKSIEHLKECCKNIKELHPDRRFETSASFFGFVAYYFNRTVEIWVQVDERNIRKIRSFNAGKSKTLVHILFSANDHVFLLKERDIKKEV
jgi:hypothetical protein